MSNINWYDWFKDIIIPLLSVISTIVLGTMIAYLLKRKEDKAKIKALLIDTYMLYLNKLTNHFVLKCNVFTYEILKDIYINFDTYFKRHANDHITKEIIKKRRDKIYAILDSQNHEASDWTPFTYQFSFLLGKKKYFKHVLPLEKDIINKDLRENSKKEFIALLKKKIIENAEIVEAMNNSCTTKNEEALDELEVLIINQYNKFHIEIFNPFNVKIAELIDEF